jgi:hypothetical protein
MLVFLTFCCVSNTLGAVISPCCISLLENMCSRYLLGSPQDFSIYNFTRFVPVRCYGHLFIYNAKHKIYNKNYIVQHCIYRFKTSYPKNDLKLNAHFDVWPVICLHVSYTKTVWSIHCLLENRLSLLDRT